MKPIEQGTPAQVRSYAKAYAQFRGVDFSTDSTQVADERSPEAQNIISDMQGYPEKRVGWRYIHKLTEPIHSMFFAVFEDGSAHRFVHAGTNLYVWDETDSEPYLAVTGLADKTSAHFVHAGKVYILDGEMYRVIEKKNGVFERKNVADAEPYVPTVRMAITGNAITVVNEKTGEYIGGHTYEEYESPNYLTDHRKCTMIGDATSTVFRLPEKDVTEVVSIKIDGVKQKDDNYDVDLAKGEINFKTAPAIAEDGAGLSNIEVEYRCTAKKREDETHTGNGQKTVFSVPEKAEGVPRVTVAGKEITDYTVDIEAHTVTFKSAPAADAVIVLTYYTTEEEKLPERINRCTMVDQFGYFNDNRFFFAGEDDQKYKNVDYMSGTDDPTYFPYDGYVRVGADTSRIMGYVKQYDAQLILKEDNEQDAQVFSRTAMYDDEGGTLFPVQQGVRGVGAAAKKCIGVLRDDPLFLAEEGVFAIVSGMVKEQRSIQDRSFYVNSRLTKEKDLANAISASWNGYFLVCVNDRCYVADARQKTAMSRTEQYGYEWYYWTNIPARVFFVHDGELFFGSNDNAICKFNSDIEGVKKYSDGSYPMIKRSEMTEAQRAEYDAIEGEDQKRAFRESIERGIAIEAVWATKADTFGTIVNVKNVLKKGCAVMIKPYTRSSIEFGYLTDREGRVTVKTEAADILDFSDIDFERFTFNTMDVPTVIPLAKKIKKFNILQIFLVSNAINEGFGVYGIQLTYTVGGYVK